MALTKPISTDRGYRLRLNGCLSKIRHPKIKITVSGAQSPLTSLSWLIIKIPVHQLGDRLSHQLAVFDQS
jgi:hypothetical protein